MVVALYHALGTDYDDSIWIEVQFWNESIDNIDVLPVIINRNM